MKHTPTPKTWDIVVLQYGKDNKYCIETDEVDYIFGDTTHFKRIEISREDVDNLLHSAKFRPIDEALKAFVRTRNELIAYEESQKTPNGRPWPSPQKEIRERRVRDEEYWSIDIDGNSWINIEGEKAQGNAAHIVKAVNCHDGLVTSLEFMLDMYGHMMINQDFKERAEALLKKAKG